jgi:hypothetical protein
LLVNRWQGHGLVEIHRHHWQFWKYFGSNKIYDEYGKCFPRKEGTLILLKEAKAQDLFQKKKTGSGVDIVADKFRPAMRSQKVPSGMCLPSFPSL